MAAFLFKFTTTIVQQNGALNRVLAQIRQGFNGLYDDFGGDLGDAIQAKLPVTPISQPIDVGAYSGISQDAPPRPDDVGIMITTFVWSEFLPVGDPPVQISTPGFYCDLLCDLGRTTIDPVWFEDTLSQRWNPGNSTTRQTTPAQQAVNGGQTEVELVNSGNNAVWLTVPEFGKHGFAGVPNMPLSGTPA